jgi:hypothetical protein
MDRPGAPTYDSTMKSGSPLRTELAVAAVILGLVVVAGFVHLVHGGGAGLKLCAKNGWALGDTVVDRDDYGEWLVSKSDSTKVLEAMYECGALRRPMREDAAPSREVSSQHAPSPTEPNRAARPALPQVQPAEPAPAQPRFVGVGAAEANRKLTQIKVQKYVHEAYPAWLRAHPGKECPHRLIELNEFMEDNDANDAWGRPLKMFCGEDLTRGAKGIEVLSLGRDAEEGTEDDIKFRE